MNFDCPPINFLKNSFKNTIRVSNSLDPDQAHHFFWTDLGPNCLNKQWGVKRVCLNPLEAKLFHFLGDNLEK